MRRTLPIFLLLLAASGAHAAPLPPLTADLPAAGLNKLSFTGVDGQAHIGVSPDDKVHVRVELTQQKASFLWVFRWTRDDTTQDMEHARLALATQGGTLNLFLEYPSGERHNDVQEDWTVQVPAHLTLDAAMSAGRLVIRDLGGGVTAHLDAGDLVIHVPGGPLDASVGTGRVHVISDSAQPGKLMVKSSFGLAALSYNGKLFAPPPSIVHFFGNTESQQGSGKDDMVVRVKAGEADLRVGPVGDDRDYKGLFDDNDK